MFTDTDQIARLWQCDKSFVNQLDPDQSESLYAGWLNAVSKVMSN
jgi:glycerol kinase